MEFIAEYFWLFVVIWVIVFIYNDLKENRRG